MAGDDIGRSAIDRLNRRVERDDATGCWNWTGHLSGGYGRIRVAGVRVQAHRFSYEYYTGTVISPELQLDHLCRNQRCVNPAHLEPVTPRENYLRGVSLMALQARQTVCKDGHPLNKRECKVCALEIQRAARLRNRDKINAQKRAWYHRNSEKVLAAMREKNRRLKQTG